MSFFLKENDDEPVLVQLNIPGSFSVYNALAAIACCRELGISKASIVNELKYAHGVKGRMEVVPVPAPFTVLIDYAHVPDAMEQVLQSVRGFAKGRIIMLFGAGGDRDVTKRPEMGEVAARLSDVAVVTTDNPRTEAPGKIIADIQSGMSRSSAQIVVIEDRRTAIAWTLENARTNDIVILAGKGHETYQEIDGIKHHFDEREIIAAFFASK